MFDVSTGPALRLLRIRYGLTQAVLAQKLGVRPSTVHTWEVRGSIRGGLALRLSQFFTALESASRGPAPSLDDLQMATEVDRAYARLLQAAEEFYRLMQRSGRMAATPHPTTLGSLLVRAGEGDSLEALQAETETVYLGEPEDPEPGSLEALMARATSTS